jgi:hypothetical protein
MYSMEKSGRCRDARLPNPEGANLLVTRVSRRGELCLVALRETAMP